jgi:hypothetical protein
MAKLETMRTTDSNQVCARRGERIFIAGIAGTDAGDVPGVTGLTTKKPSNQAGKTFFLRSLVVQ